LLRALVSKELEEVAEKFGTPRRTLLTEAAASKAAPASKAAAALQIADVPCRVLLSTTGRAVRVDTESADGPARTHRRSKHDAIRSAIATTSRSQIGAITTTGRLVRFT